MEYRIEGDNLQIVRIKLPMGEEIYAEEGRMVYKTYVDAGGPGSLVGSFIGSDD